MGVAGLARRLEAHATRYSPEDLKGYNAIIDGPSLAYHAHKLALAALDRGNVSRIPAYTDITFQALRWLRTLEGINVKVTAILFDGALPETKQAERIARTARYNQQVNGLRSNFPSTTCPIPTSLGSVSYSFLAPALREALTNSEYAPVTRNVPGEADDWCALQATEGPASLIFSDDTDLLLYDYPPGFRLLFYRDADFWPEPKFKGYSPPVICKELGLPSLTSFAYCLAHDPHSPESKLVGEAKRVDTASQTYLDFAKRYKVAPNTAELPPLQNLDVRISEFIYQGLNSRLDPVVYLPFLVEDQHRASAWVHGQDLRAVSYSIFTTDRSRVQEHRRKAQKVSLQKIELYPPQELLVMMQTYARNISAWVEWTAERDVPHSLIWPLFAIGVVLPELKSPPPLALWLRVLNADFDNTWDHIHLNASLHAALYSLRFLKQCIEVWLSLQTDISSSLVPITGQIHTDLESMGPITELFLVPGQARKPQGDQELMQELIAEVYASANVEIPIARIPNKKAKKQQREAERKERKKQEGGAQVAGNSFDVLEFMNARRN
ncbi:hypothetical protein P171DRAFT_431797 [Karstenula rhodostoma CBS 690.94]|uniref:Asteroid domain-containing protein n=1 Tax=Karstenula rhodostoma CBS 690.94 TaxID=1392251 RepID=A0A9P4PLI1_9PLEO|nr:hypothetical protein P171DRAFT_431797 [Karstenula rhodostoma CBS 690.94]